MNKDLEPIEYHFYEDRQEWADDMKDIAYRLKKDYNFYFGEVFSSIHRCVGELIDDKRKLNAHKMVMYYNKTSAEVSFVVYSKKHPTAYILKDKDISQRKVYGLLTKIKKSYNGAVNEQLQQDLLSGQRSVQSEAD